MIRANALVPLTAAAGAAAAVGIGLAAGAGSSHAAAPVSPAGSAVHQGEVAYQPVDLSKPFSAYGDHNLYDLVPGGNFAPTAAKWSFDGQAGVVASGIDVAASGSHALSLESGSSATSAAFPGRGVHSFRFYAENLGAKGSTLQVSATVDEGGAVTQIPLGTVQGSALAPTPIMIVPEALQAQLAKSNAAVRLKVTSTGAGSHWIVKNVYADPIFRCC